MKRIVALLLVIGISAIIGASVVSASGAFDLNDNLTSILSPDSHDLSQDIEEDNGEMSSIAPEEYSDFNIKDVESNNRFTFLHN